MCDADLEEIGVTARSSMRDLRERCSKSERLLQRHIHMTAHMRLLYSLGGEYPDLADLWSTEVKIQTDLGRFLDSGTSQFVYSLTRSKIHAPKSTYFSGIEHSCRFFETSEIEEKGRTVLRGKVAW
jgi:hypothetical protein